MQATAWAQQAQAWQQSQQVQQQAQQASPGDNTVGSANSFTVTGCTHATVGVIARGNYHVSAENHGRRAYKRDAQVNGLDVMVYFWDERDGPSFCGWWFGPKIGGDQVWAYHPDKSQTPPKSGWKVPYDGPVDATMLLTPAGAASPQMGQQQGWQQQQRQPQQWQQQQQQMLMQQQKNKLNMEEQRKRLEENKRKLEAANKNRLAEQQARMAQLKAQQEQLQQRAAAEKKKKEEELLKKKEEQRAMFAIRQVSTKVRNATTENIEDLTKQLNEILIVELDNCGGLKDTVKKECDAHLDFANTRIKQLEEAKKKEEERKAAEERRLQELIEKAEKLLAEFASLLVEVEGSVKTFSAEAEPLMPSSGEDLTLTLDQINSTATACESSGSEVKEKLKKAKDFFTTHAKELKPPVAPGSVQPKKDDQAEEEETPAKPDYNNLVQKMNELQKTSDVITMTVNTNKVKFSKRAEAREALDSERKSFSKYDVDKDGLLSKKEIIAYAKGEFAFTLSIAEADAICKVLVEESKKGVPAESFQRLKAYVGIAREKVQESVRREARLAQEKILADKRDAVKVKLDEAAEVVKEVEGKVKECEGAAIELMPKLKTLMSAEMTPLADEVSAAIDSTKELIAKAQKMVDAVNESLEPELKSFVLVENSKITPKLTAYTAQVQKCERIVTQFRAEVSKKELAELEAFRASALKIIRFYQDSDKVSMAGDLFKAFDTNGDGKVDESEFLAFFNKVANVSNNGDAKEKEEEVPKLSENELSRLFNYLDENDEAAISKEVMMAFIRRHYKVLKESVLTDECVIKEAKPVRRIEENEICELLEGPIKDEAVEVKRVHVKMMKDSVTGWVTPMGNQGTVFLEELLEGITMKVVKETILTSSFSLSGDADKEQNRKLKDTTRKLKEGELVEVRQWMMKEETSGLMRTKVKTKTGGHVGWATAIGNSGVVFLELASG